MQRTSLKRKRAPSFFESNKSARREPVLEEVVIESPPPFIPFNLDRNQISLLEKINEYFRLKNRPLFSMEGYCFGLAVLWLQKMAEGKVEWFYQTRDKILICPPGHFDDIEIDIEKFAALIEWGQHSKHYLDNCSQEDVGVLMDCDNVESGPFCGDEQRLSALLRDRRNVLMYLFGANDHVVAIYQCNGVYHLFDANEEAREAKIICCRHEAVKQIIQDLYHNFGEPVPKELGMDVGRIRNPHAFKYNVATKECHHPIKNETMAPEEMNTNDWCVIL